MKEQIKTIQEKSIQDIKNSENLKDLSELKVKYLGKKGELTTI